MPENKFGRLWLEGDLIRYHSENDGEWEISLQQLRILGEYTIQDSIDVDEIYFLVFVIDSETWYEAPFRAHDSDQFLTELQARLDTSFDRKLTTSLEFASNVLWPPHLSGQSFFNFVQEKGPRFGIIPWLLGFRSVQSQLSPTVLPHLSK